MIVLDASAMVEALIGSEVADELLDALTGDVHAPHLLDVEVLSGSGACSWAANSFPLSRRRFAVTTSRSPSIATRSPHWLIGSGSCVTSTRATTPRTSLWPRRWMHRCTPVTRSSTAAATTPRCTCSTERTDLPHRDELLVAWRTTADEDAAPLGASLLRQFTEDFGVRSQRRGPA